MKRSEVIQELLESYYFQYGKRVNSEVISKTKKLINSFIKEESKIQNSHPENETMSHL